MADSIIDFGDGQGQPWESRTPGPAYRDGMARTRALLDRGHLPARAEDDRALARMLGVMLLTGLLMTCGVIYGLAQILT